MEIVYFKNVDLNEMLIFFKTVDFSKESILFVAIFLCMIFLFTFLNCINVTDVRYVRSVKLGIHFGLFYKNLLSFNNLMLYFEINPIR